MNYYEEIKQELISNEINRRVKNYSINRSDLNTYYNVGKMLSEAGKHYGEGIIKEYSKKLITELNDTKYSYRNLMNMRKYYLIFKDKKVNALRSQLSWTHYRELLSVKNIDGIVYYINMSIKNNLSYRKLKEKIKSKEYERLPESAKERMINDDKTIGIIICKKDDKYIIEYSSDKRIIARYYELA